ncbi:hypothetical protein NLU13_7400 [Sarocladium strictum]|uniref:Major facilitator superfamily transporter n=1 Tax=Sarocladium strictum TaxID=5046 RepID=A0AA39GD18_SARSR|nr:hypothetical protein NLU13_7400 [Sarocladium strictum]
MRGLGKEKMMLGPPGRRMLTSRPRTRTLIFLVLAAITTYYILFSEPSPQMRVVPSQPEAPIEPPIGGGRPQTVLAGANNPDRATLDSYLNIKIEDVGEWRDPTDPEDPKEVEPGHEFDGKSREPGELGRLQHEKDLRRIWRYVYKMTANLISTGMIYGNTLSTIDYKEDRSEKLKKEIREDPNAPKFDFTPDRPVRFNPFPDYNSEAWKKAGFAPFEVCPGPDGKEVEDLLVFKGRPHQWPEPKMGSYDIFNMDANLCWERETRLGPYGLTDQKRKDKGDQNLVDWDNVNWGDLQRRCVLKNAKRFDLKKEKKNPYLEMYPETSKKPKSGRTSGNIMRRDEAEDAAPTPVAAAEPDAEQHKPAAGRGSGYIKESRSAILLRSYTGKDYTENDKQVIRALIAETTLKSGGEYEVFLLVHVKDRNLKIFDDPETYQRVLNQNIPPEFHGLTILWNDEIVWNIYTEMTDENERSVHTAQWLSVQKFSHDHPQFDYIWNWEMDFRYTGHHYDLVDKLAKFAKKQPRKGLWERNERFYIPEYHGDFDTTFRKDIEQRYGNDTVWGPIGLPFINPVGPKPPVADPADDDYKWGVGEEADVIMVGPIFNPINSSWIMQKHVWGYYDATHHSWDVPRRTTIVTQSRISKRLLDIMHVENMRGNHVASEMTPQTVALHHGLKAVFAPHPVFMDRDWSGEFVNKWFNPGKNGECGGNGSPMGWGRERRFQGTTWYYRAEPPNRLYNNFMGWIDTGIGGKRWEEKNGRPCLPSVLLHQIKNTEHTKKDHKTGFDLAYG